MTCSKARFVFRQRVEDLENRLQPGSMITGSGYGWSLLADNFSIPDLPSSGFGSVRRARTRASSGDGDGDKNGGGLPLLAGSQPPPCYVLLRLLWKGNSQILEAISPSRETLALKILWL